MIILKCKIFSKMLGLKTINKMNFLKFSLLIIVCALIVGLMPTFFKFALSDRHLFEASVIGSQAKTQSSSKSSDSIRILITDKFKIPVYIADTEEKRTKGLGGLSSIPADYGMFFVFDHSDYHGIWMKDMLFPVDIVWIDENNRIVHIENNISPNTFPKIFTTPVKTKFVLELNANTAETYDLNMGSMIFLKP